MGLWSTGFGALDFDACLARRIGGGHCVDLVGLLADVAVHDPIDDSIDFLRFIMFLPGFHAALSSLRCWILADSRISSRRILGVGDWGNGEFRERWCCTSPGAVADCSGRRVLLSGLDLLQGSLSTRL